MPNFTIFEYGELKVGINNFTQEHLDLLSEFFGKNKGDSKEAFPYSLIHEGVKFKQYVGIFQIDDLTIEILPKADKLNGDENVWRKHLIDMLSKVYKLNVQSRGNASQDYKPNTVLDLFISKYVDEVDALMHKGLAKHYHKVDENRTSLKGKLLFSKQVTKNCVHQERFFVRHTTYDYEHPFNQMLLTALGKASVLAKSSVVRQRISSTMFNFPEIAEYKSNDYTMFFDRYVFDRKTEDYKEALELAKLILLSQMPNLNSGKHNILSLLFDMNKLWEEFIFVTLKRKLTNCQVVAQKSDPFWKSDTSSISIKPDIIIKKIDGGKIFILDTKWKLPTDKYGHPSENANPANADIFQLYAYLRYHDAEKCGLVYPGKDYKKIECSFTTLNKPCDKIFLPIEENMMDWQSRIAKSIEEWMN